MSLQRITFGRRGENRAAAFFVARGFRIVCRNWSCRAGEIDLVCEKDGTTHFVEVKARRGTQYGRPEESITAGKLERFTRAVETYMRAHQLGWDCVRVDALAILAEPGKAPEYHYIEDILGS